ncbi:hypothetical protein JCM11491_005265 [Sporobolomyces phaffii]
MVTPPREHLPALRVAILDAFTSEAYRGNPAAVILSTSPLNLDDRRNLAIELNQPATAFVSHPAFRGATGSNASFAAAAAPRPVISWHTSSGDALPLCGHATMAASAYLLDEWAPDLDEIRIEIALPAAPARAVPVRDDRARDDILSALTAATGIARGSVEDVSANVTIRVSREVDLGRLDVDPSEFLAVPYRGIYLTNLSPPGSASHFRSRVFFPSIGILEDHVCGSAHTRLGPYWIEHCEGTTAPLPPIVEVDQVSPRGGKFALTWDAKWGDERGLVRLRGRAKLIMEGHLRV